MSEEKYTGFFVEWIEEWSQIFQRCDWYTFHPIQIELEHEANMGAVEMTIIVIGLGFRARYNYEETDMVSEIKERAAAIRSGKAQTVPWDRN